MDEDDKKKDGIDEEDDADEDQDLDEDLEDDDLDLDDEDGDDKEEKDSGDDEGKEGDDDEDDEDFNEKDLDDPAKRQKAVELLKKSKSALKQRAIWKDRALKAGYGKEKNTPKPPEKKKATASKGTDALAEAAHLNELTNFRLDHPDLPRRMVNEVRNYARANGMTMEKALKRPLMQHFVNDKALRERLSKASIDSKHRSPQNKPAKDWSKATPQEVEAHAREVRERANR